jgi:hypothetical protein
MFGDIDVPPEVFEFGGKAAGAGLLLIAVLLFIQGYRRLFFLVGGVGGLIGYVVSGLVAPFAIEYIDERELVLVCVGLFFFLAFQLSKTTIRIMGSMIVFLVIMMVLRVFAAIFSIDFEQDFGNLGAGIIAIIAFFSRMDIRDRLPMLMSAVLSAACCLAAIHLLRGGIISGIDLTAPRSSSFVVVMTILSMEVQNRDLRLWTEMKLRKEVEKELVKEGAIEKKSIFKRLFGTEKWKKETGMPPNDRLSLEKLHAKLNPNDTAPMTHKERIRELKKSRR